MAVSKAQMKAVTKYMAKSYYRPSIMLRKELKDAITEKAQSEGKSVSAYIQDLIKKDLGLTD